MSLEYEPSSEPDVALRSRCARPGVRSNSFSNLPGPPYLFTSEHMYFERTSYFLRKLPRQSLGGEPPNCPLALYQACRFPEHRALVPGRHCWLECSRSVKTDSSMHLSHFYQQCSCVPAGPATSFLSRGALKGKFHALLILTTESHTGARLELALLWLWCMYIMAGSSSPSWPRSSY